MSGDGELIRRAVSGLRVVQAADDLRKELESAGGRDPAGLILADLMVRHAEAAERAALALRLSVHAAYRAAELKWGEA